MVEVREGDESELFYWWTRRKCVFEDSLLVRAAAAALDRSVCSCSAAQGDLVVSRWWLGAVAHG